MKKITKQQFKNILPKFNTNLGLNYYLQYNKNNDFYDVCTKTNMLAKIINILLFPVLIIKNGFTETIEDYQYVFSKKAEVIIHIFNHYKVYNYCKKIYEDN